MSADMKIHVFEPPCTEDDLAVFFTSSLGSKHFGRRPYPGNDAYFAASAAVGSTPSIWIGEVSWLKAALFDDAEAFVPDTVQTIASLIGEELPVLDNELTSKILGAFEQPNQTDYSLNAAPEQLRTFLRTHTGKRVFTVSW